MISIAIDGPSGAGKSTMAKKLAKDLGYVYVDTGAMYRAVGYACIQNGLDYKDAAQVIPFLDSLCVTIRYIDGNQRVFVNDEDVSDYIRTPEVSMAASGVSAIPEVRKFLFETQKKLARENNVIMDGRDIGTVVLPFAQVKIFLTASAEVRAKRRYNELKEKGVDVSFDDVLEDMKKRDYDDSHRAAAPLKAAEDAVLVDTSEMDLDESVKALYEIVSARISQNG